MRSRYNSWRLFFEKSSHLKNVLSKWRYVDGSGFYTILPTYDQLCHHDAYGGLLESLNDLLEIEIPPELNTAGVGLVNDIKAVSSALPEIEGISCHFLDDKIRIMVNFS